LLSSQAAVPTIVVQSQLQAWTLRETQTCWQDLKSCQQAKETIDGLNHQRTKEMLRLPRKMLRLIVGVVYTGHICLNRHLSLLGLVNSPECGNCNEADETALHTYATAATMGQSELESGVNLFYTPAKFLT